MTAAGSPGAAAWLMDELEIDATLHIMDPQIHLGVASGSAGSLSGNCVRLLEAPEGYPSVGVYSLSPMAVRGSVTLTGRSPKPIYYFRVPAIHLPASPSHCEQDRAFTTPDKLEYIARLARSHAQILDLKQAYRERVVPAEGGDIQLATSNLKARVEADYYSVVGKLRDLEALTSSEAAGLQPQINFTIVDDRR